MSAAGLAGLGVLVLGGTVIKAVYDYVCTKCDDGILKIDCGFFSRCDNCKINSDRWFW